MANTFGTIALVYSAIGVGLSFVQDSNDDLNTAVSAVATGALYGGLSQPPNNLRTEKALSMGQSIARLKRTIDLMICCSSNRPKVVADSVKALRFGRSPWYGRRRSLRSSVK